MTHTYDARPITTLHLDHLLGVLRRHEATLLELIDHDALLKRRETDGLVIANAGPQLFEPEYEHHLYAKGIVYRRDPYRLVSLPLVKTFNHGLRAHSDATTDAILGDEDDVEVVFPEKLDGTMVQLFCAADPDRCLVTTRSVLEGTIEGDDEWSYIDVAQQLLANDHPALLQPEVYAGKSLVFECIHPLTRQVTRYGDKQRMVLLSIFDHQTYTYWSTARTCAWAAEHGVDTAQVLLRTTDLERGIERLRDTLGRDPSIPEGAIACLERQGRIVHRVKVKTEEYLKHFAMRHHITFKRVAAMLWDRPHLHDWPTYLEYLIDQQLNEEEVEALYREHFDAFMEWRAGVEKEYARVCAIMQDWEQEHGAQPEDPEARRGYFKKLALTMKQRHPDLFRYLMHWARAGGLTLRQMMRDNPPFGGIDDLAARHEEE